MAGVTFQVKAKGGVTVHGAAVLAAYPDGRYLTGETDPDGKCQTGPVPRRPGNDDTCSCGGPPAFP